MNFHDLNLLLPTLQVLQRLGLEEHSHTTEEWRGRCPCHESKSRRPRSFAVSIVLRKWYCHKCKRHGDLIDLWAYCRSIDLTTAAIDLEEEFL